MKQSKNIFSKIKGLPLFHKKPLYIVLIVICSVLILGTLGIRKFVPSSAGQKIAMQGGLSDVEISDISDGEMPSFDSSDGEMSDMAADGDVETDSIPSMDMDETEMGASMDVSEESSQSESTLFIQKISSAWLVIIIICAIIEALSIVMLARISHREKLKRMAEAKALREAAASGEIHIVRPQKKKKKRFSFAWVIVLIVIIVVVSVVNIAGTGSSSSGTTTQATTYVEAAQLGDISTILPGTGTLAEEDAEDIELPADVEISKWYVTNGDSVEAGDVLAAVDKVSVMTAIANVQTTLSSLDEALAECEDQTISETITAAADGRIIKIYAEEDVSVVDTMYESGALMLISLDGYMAVSMETEADISTGDSVSVTLSDGSEISGKVESMTNKTAVIIVSDEEATLGDNVSVESSDGADVGEGVLYIHSELKVSGFTGTVSDISVSEGDEVESGDTLITLTDTEYTGLYETLLGQRSELEAQMETLFKLYQEGYVYSTCAGVISNLDTSTSTSTDTSASDESVDADAEATAFAGEMTASLLTAKSDTKIIAYIGNAANTAVLTSEITNPDTEEEDEESQDEQNESSAQSVKMAIVVSVDGSNAVVTGIYGDVDGSVSLEKIAGIYKDGEYSTAAAATDVSAGDVLILIYEGSDISSIICMSTTASASDAANAEDADNTNNADNTDIAEGENLQSSDLQESQGSEMQDSDDEESKSTSADSFGEMGGESSTETSDSLSELYSAMQQASGSSSSDMSESSSDMSAYLSGDTTDEASAAVAETLTAAYSVETTTWLSVTPQDTMTITITVDELDILSLKVGLSATVTLDAFAGQSFEGEVSAINKSGTNSGGNSKYTAEITIEKKDGMLAGMNASAVIIINTVENVLCIPEAALIEDGNTVYVYTEYDEETDTLGGLTEVTCGVSDGENVEITSGLSEGDTYCYSCLDVVNYSTATVSSSAGNSMFTFQIG